MAARKDVRGLNDDVLALALEGLVEWLDDQGKGVGKFDTVVESSAKKTMKTGTRMMDGVSKLMLPSSISQSATHWLI